jgi:glycyl-tRNA synthetase beta chain
MAGRAALLSKADLVTGVVYEFPELQGEIGRDYATQNGEEEEVCEAVFEHYLPRSAGDDLPSTETGMAVSIGDKMDTICGCFAVGLIPTGTQDPYALRRQVIGILHIILERGLDISLRALVDISLENLGGRLKKSVDEVTSEVMEFFRARLLGIFSASFEDQEVIEAVLNAGYENVLDAQVRVEALSGFKGSDAYESLITGFKRAQNITRGLKASSGVSTDLFEHGEERELYDKIVDAEAAMQKIGKERSYTEALEILASLRGPIDSFFEKVLVMDKDESLKKNRLALLLRLTGLFSWIADFSKSGK